MIQNKPLVSVIVPVYNVELYLEECIVSILNQSYVDLEIILVNDGSPDRCGDICEDFATQDSRVIVVHKENGGLSDARNCGIDIASGEYILFVDSDDVIHYQCIELLVFNAEGYDIVFCDLQPYYESIEFNDILAYKTQEFTSNELLGAIYSFRSAAVVVACGKLFKRSIWNKIRFPKGKLHEDEFVIHHLIDDCQYIKFIDVKLYGYRQRVGSIMSLGSTKSLLDRLEAYALRKQFFLTKGLDVEAGAVNSLIIPKLLFPTVPKDHLSWKSVSTSEVLFMNNFSVMNKVIYLGKRYAYPFYAFIQKYRERYKADRI